MEFENLSYEEKLEMWLNEYLKPEEAEQIQNEIEREIQDKLEMREMLGHDEINFLREIGNYEEGEIVETGRHGWYSQYFIIHSGNKSFQGIGWFNDMCGNEFEEQTLIPVELKEVKIMKWVPIEE